MFLHVETLSDFGQYGGVHGKIEKDIADSSQLILLLSLLSGKKFMNKKINVIILIYICFCQHRILRRPNLYVL